MSKLQSFSLRRLYLKRLRKGRHNFSKKKEIKIKKGSGGGGAGRGELKKGETDALLIQENSVEENLFNRDVIWTAWFCSLFSVPFLQKHRSTLHPYILLKLMERF